MKLTLRRLRALISEAISESNGDRLSWEEACKVHEQLMRTHVFSVDPASLARTGMPSAEILQKIKTAAARVTQELPNKTGWTADELWAETVARKSQTSRES